MEILVKIIYTLLFIFYVFLTYIVQRIINKKETKYKVLKHLVYITFSFAIFMILLGWWNDFSVDLILYSYGYNFEGIDETEYYQHVKKEDLEKVKKLRETTMGIG